MVEITASTKHKTAVGVASKCSTSAGAPKKSGVAAVALGKGIGSASKKAATASSTTTAPARRGSVAPPLKPATLTSPAIRQSILSQYKTTDDADNSKKRLFVTELFHKVTGAPISVLQAAAPHAASTTRDRAGAAADLAWVAQEWGARFVLKECGILNELQRNLFPNGIEALIGQRFGDGEDDNDDDENNNNNGETTNGEQTTTTAKDKAVKLGGLKPSASAVSLSSMDAEYAAAAAAAAAATPGTSIQSIGTDQSKHRGGTPPNAREGCLLFLRGLCEIVGRPAEPYLVGAFVAAALDESSSSSLPVREAAEDYLTAVIYLVNPWAVPSILVPLLLQALHSKEWRVQTSALERIAQCATTAPTQMYQLLPTLLPALTNQVWVTKAQVSKAARTALLAVCQTNKNPDIAKCIPAVVNAICKPADTNKAVSELMGTTFVVPVDASVLAMLCPVLARALKEKLAIHKRAACLVIRNMSKLVDSPQAIAPFGNLLVPELKRVSENVQFEEIRDEALKALASLTKALGSLYAQQEAGEEDGGNEATSAAAANDVNAAVVTMQEETKRVEEEQARIQKEREAEQQREEEMRIKEAEERQRFKEAMEAQRALDKLAAEEAEAKRKEEELKRNKDQLSHKTPDGKCQSCGLKRCRKTCMFYSD